MEVRPAKREEIDQLLSLLRAYCEFYEVGPEQASDAGLEEMAGDLIDAPEDQGFLLVAVEGDRVAGFAACGWKWSSLRTGRVVVLEDLFLHPDFRGHGTADQVIGAVADVARKHGAKVLAWYTMPDNKRAQAVYDRVGGHPETLIEYELEL